MDHTQHPTDQQINLDGPSSAVLNDGRVAELYNNGLISRAEADVYDIITRFDDGGSRELASQKQ